MELASSAEALVAVALIGVINALVWPLLARLTLRLMVLTAGLLALVLNGALMLASPICCRASPCPASATRCWRR